MAAETGQVTGLQMASFVARLLEAAGYWDRRDTEVRNLSHGEQRTLEIARSLGIPVGTAKWRLHAARGALERYHELARAVCARHGGGVASGGGQGD